MTIKPVQSILCLVIFFLLPHQTWAADWVLLTTSAAGNMFYDKSSITKVNENIYHACAKTLYSENEKKSTFAALQSNFKTAKIPGTPDLLSHALVLFEIDCVKENIKDFSTIIYDNKDSIVYLSAPGNAGEWNKILPHSIAERLKSIVCEKPVASNEAVAAPKVTAPVAPKVETPVAVAPAVSDKKTAQAVSPQEDAKALREEAVRNLINQWQAGWQSGDMAAYRSCYAADFQSKGMNLDAWISHKENVKKKSKKISISIDKLQISADEQKATAEFLQSYSSSLLKDSGKKTLDLIRINGEWKILREIM